LNLRPSLTGGLGGLNNPSALGVIRSEEPFRHNSDQDPRVGVEDLRDTALAKGVVPCVKVASEPIGKPARLLERVPQFVPGVDDSVAEVYNQRLTVPNAQPGHALRVRRGCASFGTCGHPSRSGGSHHDTIIDERGQSVVSIVEGV